MTLNKRQTLETGLQSAIDLYRGGQLEDAIATLRRLARRFPEAAKLWGYLGFLHREAEDPSAATRSFRKAVELSPRSERASLGLFYSLWALDKRQDALKEMGRFAQIGKLNHYLELFRGANIAQKRPAREPVGAI